MSVQIKPTTEPAPSFSHPVKEPFGLLDHLRGGISLVVMFPRLQRRRAGLPSETHGRRAKYV